MSVNIRRKSTPPPRLHHWKSWYALYSPSRELSIMYSENLSLNTYVKTMFHRWRYLEIQEIIPAKPNLISLSDCDFTVIKAFEKIKVNKIPGHNCVAFNFDHHTIENILISWREYKEELFK